MQTPPADPHAPLSEDPAPLDTAPLDAASLYRVLAESAPDAIVTVDEASTILAVNPAVERLAGYSAEELLGRSLHTLVPERHREALALGMRRYLVPDARRVRRHGVQLVILGRDGAEIPVEVSFGAFVADGRRYVSGFLRDVSAAVARERALTEANERMQAQAAELEAQTGALRAASEALTRRTEDAVRARAVAEEERARLDRVLTQFPGAAAVYTGPDHVVRTVSGAYRAIVGGRDVIGLPLREALPELAGQGYFELLDRVYATGEPFTGARLQAEWDADGDGVGEAHCVDLVYQPLLGADGRPEGVVAFVQDHTNRYRAEEALRESELRYRLAVDAAGIGTWTWDLATDEARFDHRVCELFGLEGDRPVPRTAILETRIHAADRERVAAALAAAAEPAGDGSYESEYRVVRPDRSERRVRATGRMYFDGSGADRRPVQLIGTVVDVTEQVRSREAVEQSRERAARLQDLTAALVATYTPEDVADVVVAQGMSATGAASALLALRLAHEPGQVAIFRQEGLDPAFAAAHERFDMSAPLPVTECIRSGAPLFVESADAVLARFPRVARLWARLGTHALATVPLAVAGDVIGAMTFTFSEPRTFSADDRELFLALGRQCAQALERTRLFTAERAARHEADAARQRLAFLAEASERLAGSLDVQATLRTVADLAVPALADWCFVQLLHADGSVRPMAVVHEDPAQVELAYELLRRFPSDPGASFGSGRVLHTGEPVLVAEISDAALVAVARDEEQLALLRRLGFRSVLSVPLLDADRRPVAVLSLVSAESGRRFGAADLALAEEVARRAGAALASARLYTTEQAALRRATSLQRVAAALSGALTPEQAADVVVEQSAAVLDAEGGVVLRLSPDGGMLEVIGAVGYPREAVEQWKSFSIDTPVPLAEAARTQRPVFVESSTEWVARYGPTGLLPELEHSRSWAALPLVGEGRVLGAMGLSFCREGPLAPEDRDFVMALAQQCAQVLERARLFAAERAARAEAEAANAAKSAFLATMSHELRTPLNAIGGYAELMAMGIRGPVTPNQREDLERIQRSQRHLLGLINEVLNYAKLETGTVQYDFTDVGVAGAVAAVESLVLPQVREKALVLDAQTCDPLLLVRADQDKLQQVLVNLLSNAIKFTRRGGSITIECQPRARSRATRAACAVVEIAVRDTGIGIAADKLEAVFEPFVQVGRALNNPAEGTGLGLAISRDLARGMGGDLSAESTPGVGSTFTLTLPAA